MPLTFNIINGNKIISTISSVEHTAEALLRYFEGYYKTSLKLHQVAPGNEANGIKFFNPNYNLSLSRITESQTLSTSIIIPPKTDLKQAYVLLCLILTELLPTKKTELIRTFQDKHTLDSDSTIAIQNPDISKVYQKQFHSALNRYANSVDDKLYLKQKQLSLLDESKVSEMILNLQINNLTDELYSSVLIRKAAYFNALTTLID